MPKKTEMPDRIKDAMGAVIDMLQSGNLPQVVAKAVFPNDGKPMSAWSLSNTLICLFDWIEKNYPEYKDLETPEQRGEFINEKLGEAFDKSDYRGFKQWKEKGRHVLRGAKASYILAPMFGKFPKRYKGDKEISKKEYDDMSDEEKKGVRTETIQYVKGFFGIPVFDIKHTDGKEIEYKKLKLPQLPFMPVAKFLDIKVVPKAFNRDYYGSFNPGAKRIELCTPDQVTFFHELAHAVDDYLMKKKYGKGLKGGQQKDQEIVAQFAANTIAYMRGYKIEESTAYTKKYLEHYAGDKAIEETIKLLSRVEAIVDFITNFKEAKSPNRQAEEQEGEPKGHAEELADNPTKTEA